MYSLRSSVPKSCKPLWSPNQVWQLSSTKIGWEAPTPSPLESNTSERADKAAPTLPVCFLPMIFSNTKFRLSKGKKKQTCCGDHGQWRCLSPMKWVTHALEPQVMTHTANSSTLRLAHHTHSHTASALSCLNYIFVLLQTHTHTLVFASALPWLNNNKAFIHTHTHTIKLWLMHHTRVHCWEMSSWILL